MPRHKAHQRRRVYVGCLGIITDGQKIQALESGEFRDEILRFDASGRLISPVDEAACPEHMNFGQTPSPIHELANPLDALYAFFNDLTSSDLISSISNSLLEKCSILSSNIIESCERVIQSCNALGTSVLDVCTNAGETVLDSCNNAGSTFVESCNVMSHTVVDAFDEAAKHVLEACGCTNLELGTRSVDPQDASSVYSSTGSDGILLSTTTGGAKDNAFTLTSDNVTLKGVLAIDDNGSKAPNDEVVKALDSTTTQNINETLKVPSIASSLSETLASKTEVPPALAIVHPLPRYLSPQSAEPTLVELSHVGYQVGTLQSSPNPLQLAASKVDFDENDGEVIDERVCEEGRCSSTDWELLGESNVAELSASLELEDMGDTDAYLAGSGKDATPDEAACTNALEQMNPEGIHAAETVESFFQAPLSSPLARLPPKTPISRNSLILLISSRSNPTAFILPKGGLHKGEPTCCGALRECWEESGVLGSCQCRIQLPVASGGDDPRDRKFYWYLMKVNKINMEWPEKCQRKRVWLRIKDLPKFQQLRSDAREVIDSWLDGLPLLD